MFDSWMEKSENDHHEFLQSQMQLIQDNDSHWYIIPVQMAPAWDQFLSSAAYEDGETPDWATPVDGPHVVYFTRFCISGAGDKR